MSNQALVLSRTLSPLGARARAASPAGPDNTYLFVAINGAGLGHLTRCLAVAGELRQRQPTAKIVFFTTSLATVIVHRFGYPCFHLPPFAQLEERGIDSAEWNELFARQLGDLMQLFHPQCLIFDGTYAYGGLQTVLKQWSSIPAIWIRRAGARTHNDASIAVQSHLFRTVVIPGDLFETPLEQLSVANACICSPVVLLQPTELLSRETVKQALSLPQHHRAAYVQLGAGNINELSNLERMVLKVLGEIDRLEIVLSNSPIALSTAADRPGVRVISDYPNARYFNGFDLAILAAGYNSVVEAVALGVPAVLVPNTSTRSDDQLARANRAAERARCAVWDGASAEALRSAIASLLSAPHDGRSPGFAANGACEIAEIIEAASA